jgi:hypothetical protein
LQIVGQKSNILTGLLKQEFTEDQLAENALMELDGLLQSGLTSKEKIFAAHRKAACTLKESASGETHSCPIK